jgi:hypothetical protein
MKDESRAKIEKFDFEFQRIVIKYLYATDVTPHEVEEFYKEASVVYMDSSELGNARRGEEELFADTCNNCLPADLLERLYEDQQENLINGKPKKTVQQLLKEMKEYWERDHGKDT